MSAKTKVVIVSPCQGAYGGIEAFVLAVAEALRREPDFEVRICFKEVQGFTLQPNLKKMLAGERVMFVDRGFDRDLREAIDWADVVHLQNAPPDVTFLTKLARKPLVMTIHNYNVNELTLHRVLWRLSAAWATERWYNSQFVWDTWEPKRKRAGSRKIATTSKLPEGWTPPGQRRGFAFIGRWVANKGVDTLLDAYAMAEIDHAKWPLVLMGDGPLRTLIEYAIDKRQVSGARVLGFVDEETKRTEIQNARWMVVPPNTREDFGLTAVEARHLGVPCIITRDGGLPEAGGRQALICEPDDPAALAKLLEQAAAMDEAEYAQRAERTREELKTELEPIEFYASAFRRIARGEPAK
ncbi:MAG: glycosyltransferase family 4 protein [Chthoniobacterales bacterium]|nr:glycosyltransferase family 4 protein [Chthoniobacterales bacterium]